jgi:C1A family cysteine protease
MMNLTRFRAGTKWLTCILVAFSVTLFAGQNLLAQEYGLGDIPLSREVYQKHLKVRADTLLEEALPGAYDARNEGIVTPAKNQAYCGSCWAFATVGAMESHLLKTFGFGPSDLSEQQQVSCNLANFGCCGGYSSAAQYWETNGPIYESCFPYGDSDYGTSCPPYSSLDCSSSAGCGELGYRVVGWHTVAANEIGFKTSLQEDGPSYWRYAVYSDFYDFWNYGYPGEVYYQTSSTYQGGHAVLLIGWDDAKGAYLCKNSWGTNGGPNNDGTFWIAYSGHANDLGFGMSNFSVTAEGGCGDGTCDPGEDECNCPGDCGASEDNETDLCTDGVDNDCDGAADCDDPDCDSEPVCLCGNGVCDPVEDCNTCPNDCIGGGSDAGCGNGVCEPAVGEDCRSCPNDCAGRQTGKPSKRFCCGDDVGCVDSRCTSDGYACGSTPVPFCCGDNVCEGAEDSYNCEIDCGAPPYCGDGSCDEDEDVCSCPGDCGAPPTNEAGSCSDGIDNDCDGAADCDDGDCETDPACLCSQRGDPCSVNSECCSNRCNRGKCK